MNIFERVGEKLQELLSLIPADDITNGNIVVYTNPSLHNIRKMYVVENGKYYMRSGEPCAKDQGMSANEFLSIKLTSRASYVLAILIVDDNVVTIIGSASNKD